MGKRSRLERYKVKRILRVGLFTLLVIGGGYFILTRPIFNTKQAQYQIAEDGSIKEIELAGESTDSGEIAGEVVEGDSGEADTSLDTFAQWAVLENYDSGYRLIYPAGFEATYQYGKVDIVPPSGLGRVVVYIKDGGFTVKVNNEGLRKKDASMLEEAGKLVKSTFEFTNSPGYDPQAAQERFGQ